MLRELLGLETRSGDHLSFQDVWNRGLDFFADTQSAGVTVTPSTATQLTAVYGSWRILSEGVGQLPAAAYRDDRNGTPVRVAGQPDWLAKPNADCEWPEFVGDTMVSLLGDGNAYIGTPRDDLGGVESLHVLDPKGFEPELRNGRVVYRRDASVFTSDEVLHIPAMRRPGHLKGMSPIDVCRDAIGASLAAQSYGGNFFKNDGTPSVVVTVPGELSDEGLKHTKRAWREAHGGPGSAGSVAVLTEGAKFEAIAVTPEQAQFLESRRFGVAEIARIYGVPPHLLQDATNSTSWGSGLSEQTTNYVVHSLSPWVRRLEARFSRLMFGNSYLKFDVEGLLRGDHTTRWETHRANYQTGLVTLNEIRVMENRPPVPGGDDFLMPLNMTTAGGTPDEG